ncbi:hypothetical protein QJQ45_001217 [Haematococcus lacustris]|nr:hypothetical protein QJQ45_001217 [Haematococcus lacustris]
MGRQTLIIAAALSLLAYTLQGRKLAQTDFWYGFDASASAIALASAAGSNSVALAESIARAAAEAGGTATVAANSIADALTQPGGSTVAVSGALGQASAKDVLPWLVVLLALCVETFYAPESPALVALYLTAGISVTATLDVPQSATASSKAPCHQCTQPAATVDVTCDATCSTVTAPWTAEAKAKAVINISASATMNMDLNTAHHHSRSSILDVLPWLVVLLALCVETFYAPESPALVALYLTAGISVTATLDIPQSATASSKAPCHQCTQPVATVDATCSTVTAPWNTLHSSAGAGPSDAAPCPSPPAPQEPAALAPWMPVTSLLPPYTSTALQLSTPMPAASQQPAPLPALAAAPLRPQPHHLHASAAAALAAPAAKRSLSSCGPLAGTARTSRC